MRIKIHGGTARFGEKSLCYSCRYATIVRGARLDEEVVECQLIDDPRRVTFPVTFCTAYADRQHPTIREMEDIAWVLRSDAQRKTVGFVPARKLKREERFVLDED